METEILDDLLNYLSDHQQRLKLEHFTVTSNMMRVACKGVAKGSGNATTLLSKYYRYLPPEAREEIQLIAKNNVYYLDLFRMAMKRYEKDTDQFASIVADLIEILEQHLDEEVI